MKNILLSGPSQMDVYNLESHSRLTSSPCELPNRLGSFISAHPSSDGQAEIFYVPEYVVTTIQ